MLVINTPNNPTGAVYPRQVLAELGAVAERHGLVILSDEMYERLVHRGTHTATASVAANRERTVTAFQRLLEGLRDDRVAAGLSRCARGPAGADRQGPPVRHGLLAPVRPGGWGRGVPR